MSEMLGNQYFLSRHYELAQKEFETSLKKNPSNLYIQKKLILCYLQSKNLNNATTLLISLLSVAPEIITDIDLKNDDCPCAELIDEVQNNTDTDTEPDDLEMTLGILWLYCDVQKALEIFESISEKSSHNDSINKIIFHLNVFG